MEKKPPVVTTKKPIHPIVPPPAEEPKALEPWEQELQETDSDEPDPWNEESKPSTPDVTPVTPVSNPQRPAPKDKNASLPITKVPGPKRKFL